MSRPGTELKLAFVLVLIGVTGCNALLGNGYGVDDSESSLLDGGGGNDALVEGGNGDDGATGPDGSMTGDGSVLDANVDAAGCINGVCPTLLASVVGPQRLAVGPAGVYWATLSSIGRVGFDGSNAKTLAVGGPIAAGLKRGVAVDPAASGLVYVTMPGAGKGAAKCAADLSSCTLPGFIGSAGDASSVFVNGTHVYVGIYNNQLGGGAGGIWDTMLDGTIVQSYTMTDNVRDLQVVGPKTYFQTQTAINVTTPSTTPVSAANLLGDAPVAFVISGTTLMAATTNLHLHACTVGSAACNAVVVRMTDAPPVAITADATHAYWAEGDNLGGTIHRCNLPDCSSPTLLAEGQLSPTAIAVDATSIYWATYGDGTNPNGTIMKLAK